jgi:hypothetical protein
MPAEPLPPDNAQLANHIKESVGKNLGKKQHGEIANRRNEQWQFHLEFKSFWARKEAPERYGKFKIARLNFSYVKNMFSSTCKQV